MAELFEMIVMADEEIAGEKDETVRNRKLRARKSLDEQIGSWKKRFEGTRQNSRLARRILPIVDVPRFGAYIAGMSPEIQDALGERFKPFLYGKTHEQSFACTIANLFYEILLDEAEHIRDNAKVNVAKRMCDEETDVLRVFEDLKIVVDSLAKINMSQIRKLNLAPLDLCDKIDPDDGLLLEKVSSNVSRFYNHVKALFLRNRRLGKEKFNRIASEISNTRTCRRTRGNRIGNGFSTHLWTGCKDEYPRLPGHRAR